MLSKSEIIEKLKYGNRNFINDSLLNTNRKSQYRSTLVDGQFPYAVVISCSDSRVVPEIIFDTGIGELFVIRNAGNIADTTTIASVEYAVSVLKISIIIVLSHENCGAVTSALSGKVASENLEHLLDHIAPAIEKSADNDSVNDVAKLNAVITIDDLSKKSMIIEKALKNQEIDIIPAYYHLRSGEVEFI